MFRRLFDLIAGLISVRITGSQVEKVLNMAMARGVFISDVRKESNGAVLKVRNSGYSALKTICETQDYQIEVIKKQGVPFYKTVLKRRLGFLVGVSFFLLMTYFLSDFIWFMDVSGNQMVSTEEIREVAAKYGVEKGVSKHDFDKTEVELALLREINRLSYAKVDIKGVSLNIKVVEKTFAGPEITAPCDIVANSDGIITDILVLNGEKQKVVNDVVSKGDVIISGIIYPKPNPFGLDDPNQSLEPYRVRARGIVYARVWQESYGECALNEVQTIAAGKEKLQYLLITPWGEISMWNQSESLGNTVDNRIAKTISTPWGQLGFLKIVSQEFQTNSIERSANEAEAIAVEMALNSLPRSINDTEGNYKVEVVSSPAEAFVRVKVLVELIEEISEVRVLE